MAAQSLHRHPLALVAAVVALLGHACGGDDDTEPAGEQDAATRRDAGGRHDAAAEHDAGNDAGPPGAPTFSAIYKEIIVGTGCNAGPLCHGGAVGQLRMSDQAETYDALVDVPAMGTNLADATNANCVDTDLVRVVPNDPDASLLVQKLDPPDGVVPCGSAMPPTGMPLSAEQIEQIRLWIENGAPND
jgi:hypothetical protein